MIFRLLLLLCLVVPTALGQRFLKSYPTVQDMINAPNLNDINTNLFASGYRTNNDGGGGFFTYDRNSTLATNLGIVFTPTATNSPGRIRRQFNGSLHQTWFGTYNDGVHDDGFALSNAVRTAIAMRIPLHLDKGTNLIHNSLNVTGGPVPPIYADWITITGDGMYSSTIKGDVVGLPVFDMAGMVKSSLSDFTVWGLNNRPSCGILIGRLAGDASAGEHNFNRIRIVGECTVAGLFSLSSEVNNYETCFFTTDAPTNAMTAVMLADTAAVYGITSAYVTLGAGTGGNGFHTFRNTIISCNLASAGNAGKAAGLFKIINAQSVTLDNCIMASVGITNQIYFHKNVTGFDWINTRQEFTGSVQPTGIYADYAFDPISGLDQGFYREVNFMGGLVLPIIFATNTWVVNSQVGPVVFYSTNLVQTNAWTSHNTINVKLDFVGRQNEVVSSPNTNASFQVFGPRIERNWFRNFAQYEGTVDFPSILTNGWLIVKTNANVDQFVRVGAITNTWANADIEVIRADAAEVGLQSTDTDGVKWLLQTGSAPFFGSMGGRLRFFNASHGVEQFSIETNGILRLGLNGAFKVTPNGTTTRIAQLGLDNTEYHGNLFKFLGGYVTHRITDGGAYVIPTNDMYIVSTATSTKTLPAANTVPAGWQLWIKSGSGATTTVGRSGGNTIDNAAADATLSSQVAQIFTSDGVSNWETAIAAGAGSGTVTSTGALTLDLPVFGNGGSDIKVGTKTGTGTTAMMNTGPTASDLIVTGSLQLPNGAAPTTDAFGEVAGDNNAWAAGRGTVQLFDGTANAYVVAALASDVPSNGQVPQWNTGGTVTWETPAVGGAVAISDLTDATGDNTLFFADFEQDWVIGLTNSQHGLRFTEVAGGVAGGTMMKFEQLAGSRMDAIQVTRLTTNIFSVSTNGVRIGVVLEFATATGYSPNAPAYFDVNTNLMSGAQTGTGSTYVAQASPTITTPVIGSINSSVNIVGIITNSTLTASRLVATGANKELVSTITSANAALSYSDETGSGFAVFGTDPTFANGIVVTGLITNSVLTASAAVVTDANKALASLAYTGAGNVMRTRTGVWRSFSIPAGAFTPSITNGATAGTNNTFGADYSTVDTFDFDDTTAESVEFAWTMPAEWDAGTVKYKAVFFSAAATSGAAVFELKAKSIADNEAVSASWGTGINVTKTVSGTANRQNITANSAALTVAGAAVGERVYWKLSRLPADGSDTLVGDARLAEIVVFYLETATEPSAP